MSYSVSTSLKNKCLLATTDEHLTDKNVSIELHSYRSITTLGFCNYPTTILYLAIYLDIMVDIKLLYHTAGIIDSSLNLMNW